MTIKLIDDFLTSNKVIFRRVENYTYTYLKEFTDDSRIRMCKAILFTDGKLLHMFIELPLRVNRAESYHVFKELALINDELEINECYDLDLLTGTIRYHTVVIYPTSEEELASVIRHSMEMVAEDSDTLMQLVYKELLLYEKECSEANIAPKSPETLRNCTNNVQAQIQRDSMLPQGNDYHLNRWQESGETNSISYNDMLDILQTTHNQVIILEGPSGCGKSSMINQIGRMGRRSVVILSADDIGKYIRERLTKKYEETSLFQDGFINNDIICMEELDWLFTAQYSQLELACLISEIAKESLVVLNGVNYTTKSRLLIENISAPVKIFKCCT